MLTSWHWFHDGQAIWKWMTVLSFIFFFSKGSGFSLTITILERVVNSSTAVHSSQPCNTGLFFAVVKCHCSTEWKHFFVVLGCLDVVTSEANNDEFYKWAFILQCLLMYIPDEFLFVIFFFLLSPVLQFKIVLLLWKLWVLWWSLYQRGINCWKEMMMVVSWFGKMTCV